MTDEARSSTKRFRIISIVLTLSFLAILIFITITLLSGEGFNFDWLINIFTETQETELADEMFFNIGRARVFADLGNSIAAAGTLGIQVLDYAGSETLREPTTFGTPAINAQNGRAIAFDIGGMEARVFDKDSVLASVTKSGPIVSASINYNGWFTIDAQEGGGYRGITSVYDNNGNVVFRVSLSSGYILSSVLSDDNNTLAILNLTDYGSRVTVYHGLDKEKSDGEYNVLDSLILDIEFLDSGDLLAITAESIMLIDPINILGWEIFNLDAMRIGGYSISENFIALHLLDFGIGHRGKLIMLDTFGNLYGEVEIDRELISMSLMDDKLAVMLSDGLVLLDRSLNLLPLTDESPSASGVNQILSISNDSTMIAGDRFALIVK